MSVHPPQSRNKASCCDLVLSYLSETLLPLIQKFLISQQSPLNLKEWTLNSQRIRLLQHGQSLSLESYDPQTKETRKNSLPFDAALIASVKRFYPVFEGNRLSLLKPFHTCQFNRQKFRFFQLKNHVVYQINGIQREIRFKAAYPMETQIQHIQSCLTRILPNGAVSIAPRLRPHLAWSSSSNEIRYWDPRSETWKLDADVSVRLIEEDRRFLWEIEQDSQDVTHLRFDPPFRHFAISSLGNFHIGIRYKEGYPKCISMLKMAFQSFFDPTKIIMMEQWAVTVISFPNEAMSLAIEGIQREAQVPKARHFLQLTEFDSFCKAQLFESNPSKLSYSDRSATFLLNKPTATNLLQSIFKDVTSKSLIANPTDWLLNKLHIANIRLTGALFVDYSPQNILHRLGLNHSISH